MVLIDMEMPKECSFCKMAYDGGWCILSEEPNENVIGGMMWKKCPYGGRPSWCPLKEFTMHEPQTNADKIRQMSDEELADYLGEKLNGCVGSPCDTDCENCWIKWLKQKVEDEKAGF